MAAAEEAAGAVGDGEGAARDLDGGVGFAAELADGFDDLGDAAAVGRVVVAEAAAIGVEGELAGAADEVAVGDETSALAFGAEAEVFELDEDGDG